MTKPIPHTISTDFDDVVIWGDTDKLQEFLPSAVPDVMGAGVVVNFTRSGSSVRQYPGDTSPYSRSGGPVSRFSEPGLANKATPGKRFWCEVVEGAGPLRTRTVRQFTYVGSWSALRDAMRSNAAKSYTLRNASGQKASVTSVGP